FLRGLLRTARNVLWQLPEVVASIHEVLRQWEEQHFVRQLPTLRLAFADLTPRECDRVAQAVADHAGVAAVPLIREAQYSSIDMIQGAEVNRRVREGLRRDGLEDAGGGRIQRASGDPLAAATG